MKKFVKIMVVTLLLAALVATTLLCFTACDDLTDGYTVDKTVKMALDRNKTSLNGIPLGLIFKEDSYVELTADGKCNIVLNLLELSGIGSLLGGGAEEEGDEESLPLSETITKSYLQAAFIDGYVNVMFPDFDITDIQGSLASIKKALGVEIVGLDFENNTLLKTIDANLKNPDTDKVLPDDFTLANLGDLPSNISLTISTNYCLIDTVGEDGTKYVAALVGNHDPNTTPLMTMSYDPVYKSVEWVNYMLGLTFVAEEAE